MKPKTVDEWMERLAEKDTEIEGLKAQVEALRQIRIEDNALIGGVYRNIIREHEALITELCDAIERVNYSWPNDYDTDLLQRAREATR